MWDQRYGEAGFAYGTEPNAFLAEQAPKHFGPGDKILSLAEGEGRNAVYLAGLGADVTGVDGSAVGLAKAEALAAERGLRIRTVHSDLGDFDLGGSAWDGIISIWAHVPLELRRRLHRGVVKALKPGGVFLLEMYHPDQVALGTGGPKDRSFLADLAQLESELEGLEFLVGRELRREVQEGKYHQGPSAVVQLLGRKPFLAAS